MYLHMVPLGAVTLFVGTFVAAAKESVIQQWLVVLHLLFSLGFGILHFVQGDDPTYTIAFTSAKADP